MFQQSPLGDYFIPERIYNTTPDSLFVYCNKYNFLDFR
jgi:hypothetical protein